MVGEQIKNLQLREGLVVITSRDKAPTTVRDQKARISLRILVQFRNKGVRKAQNVVTLSL